jgi:PTH1 family peptidyl-tRNA hydrolase
LSVKVLKLFFALLVDYLVCGLGNPGEAYAGTRHNAGFEVVDLLAVRFRASWQKEKYGWTASVRVKGRPALLLKPDTYMNLSGKSVKYHLEKLSLSPSHLLVITDDIALPVGYLRLRMQGSSGGHNGLASVEEYLGTSVWPRLRIGVGNNFPKGRQADYVLSRPTPEEEPLYKASLLRAADAVVYALTVSLPAAMNRYNGPLRPEDSNKPDDTISDSGRQQS